MVVNGTPQTYAYCQSLLSGSSRLRMGWTLASDAQVRPWLCSLQAYYTHLPCRAAPPLFSWSACGPVLYQTNYLFLDLYSLPELKFTDKTLLRSALHVLPASESLLGVQGNGTLMTGMFQCAAGGWCGWGFPRAAGEMIGTSALIARTCAACASGAQPDLAPAGPMGPAYMHA